MSEASLATLDMGQGWIATDDYTYPLLADNCTDKAIIEAARLIPTDNDRTLGIITGVFHLGCPGAIVWTASIPNIEIAGNEASWLESYNGEFTMTATCGNHSRDINMNAAVEVDAGLDAITGNDKTVDHTDYFTTTGIRVIIPLPGQLYIKRTVYTDGTVEAETIIMR